MGNCKDLKPGRIIFYLLPILYCRFEKQKGFMKTMTTLLSLCVNTGLTDTVLPQRGIVIRALVRVVTRSVVAVRETVTLVYLIKTLIYGKQRESKDHRIKKRERERERERERDTMFHLVQSNLIQVLDARNEKNKTIQNKNKKKRGQ